MENLGEIYCVTSPSGKKYIGQCVKQLSSGKKWGYINRWKDHVRDAYSKDYCRLLNCAIRKYGSENFKIEVIKECLIEELNNYEAFYIDSFGSLSPNGYNLMTSGSKNRHSEESNNLKRISMIGKNVGKRHPKRERKREEDNKLPKYVRYYTDINQKEGYRVSNHPILKDRSFVSKHLSLDVKLDLALKYLAEGQIKDEGSTSRRQSGINEGSSPA